MYQVVAGQNFVYLFYTETENKIKYSFIEFFNVDLLDPGLFIWKGSSRSLLGNSDLPFRYLSTFYKTFGYVGTMLDSTTTVHFFALPSVAIRKNSKYVDSNR